MSGSYELIGSRGCGSMIVEMALGITGLDHTVTDVPYLEPGPARDRLLSLNPLGQVPTLVLPDGRAMSESAAMILHIADVAPASGLVPPPGAPKRPEFLNLLVMMVAAVYPTFTFADDPQKFAVPAEVAGDVKAAIDARRLEILRRLDGTFSGGGRFALGDTPTAVDLYIAVMVWWRPGRDWFRSRTPRLSEIAEAATAIPAVRRVVERHELGT